MAGAVWVLIYFPLRVELRSEIFQVACVAHSLPKVVLNIASRAKKGAWAVRVEHALLPYSIFTTSLIWVKLCWNSCVKLPIMSILNTWFVLQILLFFFFIIFVWFFTYFGIQIVMFKYFPASDWKSRLDYDNDMRVNWNIISGLSHSQQLYVLMKHISWMHLSPFLILVLYR